MSPRQAAKNADYQMTRADLESYEKKHGRIPDNACVAMNSGWARYAGDPAKFTGKDAAGAFHFPGVSPDAAQWLLTQRKVAGLAVDTLSLDHGPSKDFKTHYLVAAVRPMGSGECRRPGPGAGRGRDAGGRCFQGEGCDRRDGAAVRAGLNSQSDSAGERSPGPFRDPGLFASRHDRLLRSVADVDALHDHAIRRFDEPLAPAAVVAGDDHRARDEAGAPVTMMVMAVPAGRSRRDGSDRRDAESGERRRKRERACETLDVSFGVGCLIASCACQSPLARKCVRLILAMH